MAKRPSKSSHRMRPEEGLNLTPFIDMITCLMFFLLMFAGIIPVVMIDAPLPKVASTAEEVKKAKQDENKQELTVNISPKGFGVKIGNGGEHMIGLAADGKYQYAELHKYLVTLKPKRQEDKDITLMPTDDTPYEVMIGAMDAARELTKTDPGYQPVPPEISQKPESQQFNRLFPDVSIGGV